MQHELIKMLPKMKENDSDTDIKKPWRGENVGYFDIFLFQKYILFSKIAKI